MFDPSDYMCAGKRPRHRKVPVDHEKEVNEKTPLLVTSQPGKSAGRKSRQQPHYGGEMLYPEMMAQASFAYKRKAPRLMKQSRSGWADSDSEEEYRRDPRSVCGSGIISDC